MATTIKIPITDRRRYSHGFKNPSHRIQDADIHKLKPKQKQQQTNHLNMAYHNNNLEALGFFFFVNFSHIHSRAIVWP